MGFVGFLRKFDLFGNSTSLLEFFDSTKKHKGNGLGGIVTIATFMAVVAYLYVSYISIIKGNKNMI
jgi:hypothetical protein